MKDWCLEVWGDYACFTRPEMKVERVSYDVITPSASRAIFEAILWKPAIRWHISKIEVLNPIKWISVRRNEVGKKVSSPTQAQFSGNSTAPMGIFVEEERQQRAGLLLRDVRYRLYAQFEFIPPEERVKKISGMPEVWANEEEQARCVRADEKEAKYAAMFERRAKKGQCFHRPYLGCREFACNCKLVDPATSPSMPVDETRDLGFMLYDMDFEDVNNPKPLFFRAGIRQGIVLVPARNSEEVRG